MIKKLLLWTTLFALPLVGGVYGVEESEEKPANKTIFNQLPHDVFHMVHQYLNAQDSWRLEQASRELKNFVHSAMNRPIGTVMSHLNCVNPSTSNTRVEERLNQLVYNRSLHPLLREELNDKLKKDKFLFAPHESPLEWVLVDVPGLRRISLREGLVESNHAPALYEALFGQPLPEVDDRVGYDREGYNRHNALDHLAACLPVHGIYVDENLVHTDEDLNEILSSFFATNGEGLNAKLQNMGKVQRYFSFGVTENEDLLKENIHYNIVVNQRQLPLLRRLGLPVNHLHRIILKIQEAPDGVLSFNTNQLPLNVGKLCIVDNDHLSSIIGTAFLMFCRSLTSLDMRGLQNVESIGNYFLEGCTSLTSLDTGGLQNVMSIGTSFLQGCTSLTSLDTGGLQNVKSIGDDFLRGCSNLTSLDTSVFQKVMSIGTSFLRGCSNLTSLDTSVFQKVMSIGTSFLSGCSSLTSLDTRGLQNVEHIAIGFLDGCPKLDIDPEKLRAEILERGKANALEKKSET